MRFATGSSTPPDVMTARCVVGKHKMVVQPGGCSLAAHVRGEGEGEGGGEAGGA